MQNVLQVEVAVDPSAQHRSLLLMDGFLESYTMLHLVDPLGSNITPLV